MGKKKGILHPGGGGQPNIRAGERTNGGLTWGGHKGNPVKKKNARNDAVPDSAREKKNDYLEKRKGDTSSQGRSQLHGKGVKK